MTPTVDGDGDNDDHSEEHNHQQRRRRGRGSAKGSEIQRPEPQTRPQDDIPMRGTEVVCQWDGDCGYVMRSDELCSEESTITEPRARWQPVALVS